VIRWSAVAAALAAVLAGGGCGKRAEIDRERAATLFTEVTVDTAPGLSGLAVDEAARSP